MRIELLANDGSPLQVIPPDVYNRGVGGAELAMISLMQQFAKMEHEVIVYNDPSVPGVYDGVDYRPLEAWDPRRNGHEVVIAFRSPNVRIIGAAARLKVWWSCDQFTIGDFAEFAQRVEMIVTISPNHKKFFLDNYDMESQKVWVIDLGVLLEDYTEVVEKVRNRLIYCSVPDRGLLQLQAAWAIIKRDVPDATLTITSDYSLWNPKGGPRSGIHRLSWVAEEGVEYLGNVPRKDLVRLQQEAEIMSYPCIYDELFCISVAECQVAGAVPVTSGYGALTTTNEYGVQVPGNPSTPQFMDAFTGRIVSLLTEEREHLEWRIKQSMLASRTRFDWDIIGERWIKLFKEKMKSDSLHQ